MIKSLNLEIIENFGQQILLNFYYVKMFLNFKN